MSTYGNLKASLTELSLIELHRLSDDVNDEIIGRDPATGKHYSELTSAEMWNWVLNDAYYRYKRMYKEPKYTTLQLNQLSKDEFTTLIDKYVTNRSLYSMPGNRVNVRYDIMEKEIERREAIWGACKDEQEPVY